MLLDSYVVPYLAVVMVYAALVMILYTAMACGFVVAFELPVVFQLMYHWSS